ncbi:hypothetical protein [Algoriphagus sp. NG3]|nr:hypothetical protein [Algoriphagus sp. NG3]WPR77199.1 hypothetical protein SLW71_07565 [Algoriphagus sp. NG3]
MESILTTSAMHDANATSGMTISNAGFSRSAAADWTGLAFEIQY